jgi:predicted patatin/cPLA2 family phospholipase
MRTLVLEGGGMRGAFNYGVLFAFNEHGINYKFFDNYIGTSAGAFNAAYFLTEEMPKGMRVYRELLTSKFINYRKLRPAFDIEYLKKVISEIEPLSIETLKKRRQKIYLPLSDPKTLKAKYFCLNTYKEPIKLLLANASFPFFAQPINLEGHTYYDGGISALIPLDKAKQLKSDEIWVVCNTPAGYRRKRWRYWLSASFAPRNKGLRRLLLNRPARENAVRKELETNTNLVVIRPEKSLPITWLNRNPLQIEKVIELGKQTAEKVLASI